MYLANSLSYLLRRSYLEKVDDQSRCKRNDSKMKRNLKVSKIGRRKKESFSRTSRESLSLLHAADRSSISPCTSSSSGRCSIVPHASWKKDFLPYDSFSARVVGSRWVLINVSPIVAALRRAVSRHAVAHHPWTWTSTANRIAWDRRAALTTLISARLIFLSVLFFRSLRRWKTECLSLIPHSARVTSNLDSPISSIIIVIIVITAVDRSVDRQERQCGDVSSEIGRMRFALTRLFSSRSISIRSLIETR